MAKHMSTSCGKVVGLKKGPWTPEEDQKLLSYIEQHGGHGSWQTLPAKAGLRRCGKSCRLRWINYLRPDIKRGNFSLQEQHTIIQLHAFVGNKWSAIASHLPNRTDNEIKNYWNSHLKKRLLKMGIDPETHQPSPDACSSGRARFDTLRHTAQWESVRLEAEARLARDTTTLPQPITYHKPLGGAAGLAPSARPPCLDVLKAYKILESPSSTLNLTQNAEVIAKHVMSFRNEMVEEDDEKERSLDERSSSMADNAWFMEVSNENNTMEGLLDVLVFGTNGHSASVAEAAGSYDDPPVY